MIERIHTDYELAQQRAISRVLGEQRVYGCLFHYIKALIHQLRTKWPNLFRMYTIQKEEGGPIRKWIRRIAALPTLRHQEIRRIWIRLGHFSNDIIDDQALRRSAAEFSNYVERQWIKRAERGIPNIWNFNRLLRTRSTNPAGGCLN